MTEDAMPEAERIGRYIDGEMDAAERAAFEAALAQDPALTERVARLTDQDARLRAAFELPVDEALLARLGLADGQGPAAGVAPPAPMPPAEVIDFADAKARRAAALAEAARAEGKVAGRPVSPRWRWAAGAAMAAVVALAVALPLWPRGEADPAASAAFQIAMDSAPSRTSRALESGAIVVPQLSFADQAGRYCREYALGGSQAGRGIACRAADGRWAIEAQVEGGAEPAPSGGIRTAAGDDTAALDAAYARLGASDPFDAARENALIANQWAKAGQ